MMTRSFISILFLISGLFAREWVEAGTSYPSVPVWSANTISDNQLEISFDLGGYFVEDLANGKTKITFPVGVSVRTTTEGSPKIVQYKISTSPADP